MDPERLRFVDLLDIGDDLLLPWLELYETAFPPSERLLVAAQLQLLKRNAESAAPDVHMLAVLDERETLAGILQYEIVPDVSAAFLWYLAVQPAQRNRGLGAQIYREMWKRLETQGCQALVLEVEIPEEAESDEQRQLAIRRIGFYRRLGARLMLGVEHMQEIGWHHAPTPMHVMIDARPPADPGTAYSIAEVVLDGAISQVGTLALD